MISVPTRTVKVALNASLPDVNDASRTPEKLSKIAYTVTLSYGLYLSETLLKTWPTSRSLIDLNLLPHGQDGRSCLHQSLWLRPAFITDVCTHCFYVSFNTFFRHLSRTTIFHAFHYTGHSDETSCFHCNLGLWDWLSSGIPFEEHVRWSPTFVYLNFIKGPE